MTFGRKTVPLLALAAALLGGCGSEAPGVPMNTGSATSSETSQDEHDRPSKVTFSGVDPCTLVPQDVLDAYEVASPGRPRSDENAFDSPGCFYSTHFGSISLYLSEAAGVEVWPARQRTGVRVGSERDVVGFPAIRVEYDAAGACYTVVDTAENQSVIAKAIVNSSEPSKVGRRCEYSYEVAEAAMSSLLGG